MTDFDMDFDVADLVAEPMPRSDKRYRPPGSKWTEEREARLREMHAQGHAATAIAKDLNCGFSRNAICGKLDRLGLRRTAAHSQQGARIRKRFIHPRPRHLPIERQHGGMTANKLRHLVRRERRQEGDLSVRPPRIPLPPQAPTEAAGAIPATAVNLWGLTEQSCRWPFYEGSESVYDKLYCGAVAEPDLPYCPFHCRQAYTVSRGRG